MALTRNTLGRFGRQAEVLAPPEPAAPPVDDVATSMAELRRAEEALLDHNLEISNLRASILASQSARADSIARGDVDAALTAEDTVRRLGVEWEAVNARGADLTATVERARQLVTREQWRQLQPRLHASHEALNAAALALVMAIETTRNLEQQARNLGVQSVPDTPSYQGLNGHLVDTWARSAWHAQSQQERQAA
jgi:hypothetical protein